MKSLYSIIYIFLSAVVLYPVFISCRKEYNTDPVQLPDEVRPVAMAIMEDSPDSFAAVVTYPLERPYPLRNIMNSSEMALYYSIMIDDSLKNMVKSSTDTIWNHQGWRGWTLADGSYMWIDNGKIYAFNYISGKESQMLDSLREMEISTLDPSLRQGWIPVLCVVDTIEGDIFRIDSDNLTDTPVYRLARYCAGDDLAGKPFMILYGSLDTEGTMGNRFYHFKDSTGNNAEYSPDMAEEDSVTAFEMNHSGHPKRYHVVPTYWLDHVNKIPERHHREYPGKNYPSTRHNTSTISSILFESER